MISSNKNTNEGETNIMKGKGSLDSISRFGTSSLTKPSLTTMTMNSLQKELTTVVKERYSDESSTTVLEKKFPCQKLTAPY